jgi:replicative DNA helicase
MLRMGRGFAEGGHRVAWLAGEMNPRTLVLRTICQVAGLGRNALNSDAMPPDHERKLAAARRRLDAIGDRIRFTAAPIGFEAIDQAAEWAEVVFIDYLQLVRHDDPSVRGHERIEDTMARIAAAAQRTGAVFVVAAAQGREGGSDRRGIHTATRGSSSIEYGADAMYCAMEVSREQRENPAGFEVAFECLKQREGEQRWLRVPIDGRTGLVGEEVRP